MSSYTHKNLNDTKDMAAEFGLGHIGEARFPYAEVDAEQTGFSHQRIKPDQRQGFGHKHEDAEEVYVVIAGSGQIKLDDEILELERLDVIRISPEVMRSLAAGPDGLEVLAFGARHEGDGEMVQEWWTG